LRPVAPGKGLAPGRLGVAAVASASPKPGGEAVSDLEPDDERPVPDDEEVTLPATLHALGADLPEADVIDQQLEVPLDDEE